MTFGQSVGTCLHKYVQFDGRASRPEYWWFVLFTVLVETVPAVIGAIVMVIGLPAQDGGVANTAMVAIGGTLIGIAFLVSFGLLLPSLAVAARRLSDAGLSPWLLLLMLVPFGSIALVVMFLLPTAAPRPSVGLA